MTVTEQNRSAALDRADNAEPPPSADDVAERVFESALGAFETLAIYLGDRLGWYRALAEGPATAGELASRTGTQERYAREWLEQQAVAGLLTTDPVAPAAERAYTLPAAAAEVLTDEASLAYLAPLARMVGGAAVQLPSLVEAYTKGGGVSWEQLGDDGRCSQADMNRPWFEHRLAPDLEGVPEVHARLSRPGVRIADVGCGFGWSSVALARAYPDAQVDGYEVDAPSVAAGLRHAEDAGLSERLRFHHVSGADLPTGAYDAVFAFECIHDMPRPVEVLAAVRRALRPDGVVVIMDEAVSDRFTAPGDDVDKLMYGFSLFVCLPDGLSSSPSAGTGTVMRRDTLADYAGQAGFSRVEVLPIEGFGFWRFYRLHP